MRIEGRRGVAGRNGQALIELAAGLFTLVLLASALTAFTLYIVRSLEIENNLRGRSRGATDKIELDSFAAEKIFGIKALHINEPLGSREKEIW